jgi:hypothetical protein
MQMRKTRWRAARKAMVLLAVPACLLLSCGQTESQAGGTGATAGSAGSVNPVGNGNTGGSSAGTRPIDVTDPGMPGMPTVGGAEVGGTGPGISLPGTSSSSMKITCGAAQCTSVKTLAPNLYVDPCCVDDACGVDTQFLAALGASFTSACQATHQTGELDAACPPSPERAFQVSGTPVTLAGFAGCCRAETGTCGVVADSITAQGIPLPFASPQLGCVDSAPFFNGKPAATCGAPSEGGALGVAGSPAIGGALGGGGAPTENAGAPSVPAAGSGGA